MKVNVEKLYPDAIKYMADGEKYSKDTVVSCYLVYKAFREMHNVQFNEKNFVVENFLKYLEDNKDSKYVQVLQDYYFNYLSHIEIAQKYYGLKWSYGKEVHYALRKNYKNINLFLISYMNKNK